MKLYLAWSMVITKERIIFTNTHILKYKNIVRKIISDIFVITK